MARHLHNELVFTNVDQGDIVWGLIAHTQALAGGNWRVTKGASTTGQLRDRTYKLGENIGTLAADLQDVINGLWWNIDANLVYTAHMPDAFARHVMPIQLGVNARRIQRKGTASTFGNSIYGDAHDTLTVPVWADAPDINTDPRGRWENAYGWPTVELQETLQEHVDGQLQIAQSPPATWTVDLEPRRWIRDSSYRPGDFVKIVTPPDVTAPLGSSALTSIAQVIELSATADADGGLSVGLTGVEVES
jgi:hypothetical protein